MHWENSALEKAQQNTANIKDIASRKARGNSQMYKIKSKYIFEEKEPLSERMTVHTTHKMFKVLQYIALDNDMSVSMVINNALAQYIINDIKKTKSPH